MCGICGIIYKDKSRPVEQSLIKKMSDSIAHRGPDDSGEYLNDNIGLGHRRLSIVDLKSGQQPMSVNDKRYWIIFNGEIYNHLDLRPGLEKRGCQYHTNCDTETILHAYAQYGMEALQKLQGMFAFAIYDNTKSKLIIARDRIGIKPLYYIDTSEFFAFSSEIKALLQIDGLRRNVNHSALLQMLALKYTTDDTTMFTGIKKLPPGHYLEYENGVISMTRYWDFDHITPNDQITETEAVDQFRKLFDESIQARLMADVPLGMFLSGGLDSTVISTRMSRMIDRKISTFSVAFKEREANELYYARQAATNANADHHEVTMSTEDFFQTMPRMIYHEDEPLAHPSSIALYRVSDLASKHVKVVLTGEGSDELFGGYERYYQTLYNLKIDHKLFSVLPRSFKKNLFRPLINMLPYKFPYRNKAVRTILYLDNDLETIFLDNYSTFSRPLLKNLLTGNAWNGTDPNNVYAGFMNEFKRSSHKTMLGRILYADMKTYLQELLMKQDQMSMAASIESRVPFLDHRIIEFAFSLPDYLKIKRFDTKRILRLTFGAEIPEKILNRPKEGFPVPIKRWFRNEYHQSARQLVMNNNSYCSEIFDKKELKRYFDLHQQGKYNYSDQIWTFLNIEMWHQIFIRIEPVDSLVLEPK